MKQVDSTYINPNLFLETASASIEDNAAVIDTSTATPIKNSTIISEKAQQHFYKEPFPDSIPGPKEATTHFDIFTAAPIVYVPETEVQQELIETIEQPKWQTGYEGTPRHLNVGDDSGVLAIIAGIFILVMLSFKHIRRIFNNLGQDLWGMRRRANAFNEHTTNESRTIALMALQWCIYTGLLLYSGIATWHGINPAQAFPDAAKLILLAGGYYIFELGIYNTLGYTFTDNIGRKLLIKGYNASQSLLGFLLIIPALVSIFYPTAAETCITVSAVLYILARISFIIKGFRIFYTNFDSILYFILYLCALEIVPILIVYKFALLLVK